MSEPSRFVETPIGMRGRAILLALTLFLVGGFCVARMLDPDPRGFGTHQQLGFPPCSFRFLFGIPCPGCGMTTCFAHFVRGQIIDAVRANPAGAVLATASGMLIPWSLVSLRRGRLWMVSDPLPFAAVIALSLASLVVLVWVTRLVAQFGIPFSYGAS